MGSLSPSTRHHPSSYTGNLRACSPSLPRRPSPTTRYHSLGTSTDTTLQPPAHSFADPPPPPGTTHWAPPPTPPSSPQLTHSQTLPHHQVPLIGHLHRHHPPAPSSLILGSLSLSLTLSSLSLSSLSDSELSLSL